MTDSSTRKALSRRGVVASYAISVAIFLGCVSGAEYFGVYEILFGPLFDELSGIAGFAIRLFLLLPALLGLSGFVISVRQPDRVGWFICGHVCLIVYSAIWVLSILGMFVWAVFEGIHC